MSKCINLMKRLFKLIFSKRPIRIEANIICLAPNEFLKGRVALITGGTSGIGFSIADSFLNAGCEHVVITGRSKDKCIISCNKLQIKYPNKKINYCVLDNRNISLIPEKIIEIQKLIYPLKISILVNNAGVQSCHFGETKEEDFDEVIGTNLKGAYFLSQEIARYMINNNIQGNILNVASSSSLRPAANAYTISKVAIKEMTAGLAKTLIPYGIVVNGIAPGPTATPMLIKDNSSNLSCPHNPLGRFALPEEIANMAVMMTSDLCRTAIGSIFYMTGGGGITTFEDVKYPFKNNSK